LSLTGGATATPQTSGGGVATLTAGSFSTDPFSVLNILITPSSNSTLAVTGTATVTGGHVHISPASGSYTVGTTYTILTAATVSGTFNPTVIGAVGLLSYPGGSVLFTLGEAPPPPPPPLIPTDGLPPTEKKIADYLNNHAPPSAALAALQQLTGGALERALNSVSPARNAAATLSSVNNIFSASRALSEHLNEYRFLDKLYAKSPLFLAKLTEPVLQAKRYLASLNPFDFIKDDLFDDDDFIDEIDDDSLEDPFDPKYPRTLAPLQKGLSQFWMSASGQKSHQDGTSTTPSFDLTGEMLILGMDKKTCLNHLYGGAIGYAHTHLKEADSAGKATTNYGYGSAYGVFHYNDLYLDCALFLGFFHTNNDRHIFYPGFNAHAESSYNGLQLSPHIEIGNEFSWKCLGIEPFISTDFANLWQQGFHEHGASSMNIHQKFVYGSMLKSEAGFHLYQAWETKTFALLFSESVSYVRKSPFQIGAITTIITGGTGSLQLDSFSTAQNLAAAQAMIVISPQLPHHPYLSISYAGEYGSGSILNEIKIQLIKRF